jgi:thioredoxin 1
MNHEWMHTVTTQNFEKEVLASKVPVLVNFTTEWCGPCRTLKTILQRLAEEQTGRVKILTVNGDAEPELVVRFGVRGYPTVIAWVSGHEVARNLGLTTKERLLRLLPVATPELT